MILRLELKCCQISFNSYHRYIREDVEEKDLPGLTDRQLTKIKSKMKSSWFKSLMLKKKVLATLDFEECAEKQIFVYHIMENWSLVLCTWKIFLGCRNKKGDQIRLHTCNETCHCRLCPLRYWRTSSGQHTKCSPALLYPINHKVYPPDNK